MERTEHFVDIAAGTAEDRPYPVAEGVQLGPSPQELEHRARVEQALTRLKAAAMSDENLADLLLILGVE